MKRKRILSLLLALAVMATMLMAVPLTGYAATVEMTCTVSSDGLQYTWLTTSATSDSDTVSAYTDSSGLTLYDNSGTALELNKTASYSFTIGDTSSVSSYGIKTGGASSTLNSNKDLMTNPAKRCVVITPQTNLGSWQIEIAVKTNSSGKERSLYAQQNNEIIATATSSSDIATGVSSTQTDVENPIYIWTDDSVQIYGIRIVYEGASTGPAVKAVDLSINAGESGTISPTATNFSGDDVTYSYELVDGDGTTTSYDNFTLESGTVTVSADATNGETAYVKVTGTYTPEEGDPETASCIVTVTAVNVVLVTEVSVSPEEATIYFGQTKTLTATVSPEDATDTSVTWSSGDTEVATVDSSGKVSPKEIGKATITATANDGSGKTGSATIEVKDPTYPDSDGTITIGDSKISTSDLTAASESKIYSLLDTAETAKGDNAANENGAYAYKTGYKYFDGEVAFVGDNGNLYQTGKSTQDIDGTTNSNGIRIKTNQDVVAVHLAEGSTVRVYIKGGGSGSRYGYLTTSKIKSLSTSDYASDSTAQTGDLKNYATDLLEYTATSDTIAYISATGDSFISELQVIVPGEADSGRYTNASDETVGVIRFLQSYADDNISSYGFYFVDSDGEITVGTTPSISDGTTGSVEGGFSADITDIPEANLTDTYYALPFVTYENIDDPVYMSVITQVGVNDTTVNYETAD